MRQYCKGVRQGISVAASGLAEKEKADPATVLYKQSFTNINTTEYVPSTQSSSVS